MGQLSAFVTFVFLTASPAWAQTAAPGAAGRGGIGDYWWIILLVLAALAIWYFMKRNRRGL
ncbi:MAG TPA: hypothetical protein VHL98_20670 [Microvirga sp.]|jgi:Na+/proline symporter|nr:hypothetical protein [Microvirga sp.]